MAVSAEEAQKQDTELDRCIATATDWLLKEQAEDGSWAGMLESSYCMEAEWLLAMHFLGYEHPRKDDLVATLLHAQREREVPDPGGARRCEAPRSTRPCY